MALRAIRSVTARSAGSTPPIPHTAAFAVALCNAHNTLARCLSTSAPSSAAIGPEHPHYIEVPKPATRIPAWKIPRKGFVPKPRNVLKNSSNRLPKHSPGFLDLVTPEPTRPRIPPPDKYGQEKMGYKQELAAVRRRNLREGIVELHERQVAEKEKRRKIAERRQKERDEILAAAAADDVAYTLPTVDRMIKDKIQHIQPDSRHRFTRRNRKYARLTQKHRKRKVELVHDLFQNAHSFILTEAQLDEAILQRFPEGGENRTIIPQGLDVVKVQEGVGNHMMQDWLSHELGGAMTGGRFAGHDNAFLENDAPNMQGFGTGGGGDANSLLNQQQQNQQQSQTRSAWSLPNPSNYNNR